MSEITNYNTLMSVAEGIAGRAMIGGAMTLLTADLNKRLRVRQMLKEVTQSTNALPSDFLQADAVKVAGVFYRPAPAHSGFKGVYSISDDTIDLSPENTAPDLVLTYYAELPVLASDGTNAVLSAHPDLYLYGVLAQHAQLVRDADGAQLWGTSYESILGNVTKADVKSRVDTATMRVRPRSVA